MKVTHRFAALGLAAAAVYGSALVFASTASAASLSCPDHVYKTCGPVGWYTVKGTDGTLAIQAVPYVDNVSGYVAEGAPVEVLCQVNDAGTDPYDHLYSRTWDKVYTTDTNGDTVVGWVYDHYVTTPLQDPDGWSVNQVCSGW